MVVPMLATSRLTYAGVTETCGRKVLPSTSPQSGPTMKLAATYVTKTQAMASRIFSMRLYEPLMPSSHTAMAAMGTLTMAGTPKSCMPEAMPANSESVTVVLLTMRASMANALLRTPNCSRMSAAKPLPVTQPMRAAVSCTTMSRKHITGIDQS